MSGGHRPTVFLHIGAPKTGTTYLQHVLWNNRAALRADGLLYPGDTSAAHFWASLDVRGASFRGHRDPGVDGAWRRLVAEVRAWGGTAVIDHETFGSSTKRQVERILGDLAFAEVHVVYTARDLARQLPAVWQERVKNGDSTTFAAFLEGVRAKPGRQRRRFWAAHDVAGVLARWAQRVSPERVHLVTVPPRGSSPDELWTRFATLLGLKPDRYDTRVTEANVSLGATGAAVLRRLNAEIGTSVPWPVYRRVVKRHLAPVLAGRARAPIALPTDAHEWAVAWAQQTVSTLAASEYDVVGDLHELIPGAPTQGVDPDSAPLDDQLNAAVAGVAALLSLWDADSTAAHRPVRRHVRRLAGRVRWVGVLQRRRRRRGHVSMQRMPDGVQGRH